MSAVLGRVGWLVAAVRARLFGRLAGRRRIVGAAGIALAAGVTTAVVGLGLLSTTQAASGDVATHKTVAVERRTLVVQKKYSGTLGYSGDFTVVNQITTRATEDVASLNQAALSAQAAYEAAVRALDGIRKPTAESIAGARAQVAQAQAALAGAQAAAAGPTDAQRTQAEAAVARVQINLTADNEALTAARAALADCQAGVDPTPTPDPSPQPTPTPTPTPTTPDCSAQLDAVHQAEARVASDGQDLLVAQAELNGLSSATSQAQADANLASARAQLAAAQATLAAMLNPTARALAEAQSNVAVAKANLDAAQARLGQLRGIVTSLPAEGSVVERGGPLYELDGQPSAVLMYGERPAWRAMAEGIVGQDVRQLQENLVALGFAAGLTANGTFDAATTAAVKSWQQSLGRPQTGIVEFGDVVFLEGAIRIATHTVSTGDTVNAGAAVLTATSTDRVVTVDLAADEQGLVSIGDGVDVQLPDGSHAPGKVKTVGTVATAGSDGGTPTIEVTISLDDPAASGTVDQAPVNVRITTVSRENVLAVPVNALLALLEGGYAVEVAADDGTTHLVGVKTGIFQDGWVEIDVPDGGLAEGDNVVVPS